MHLQHSDVLVADRLSVIRQGTALLQGISVSVPYGAIRAVVGPNAARSVFFDCIVGERRPSAGTVWVNRMATPTFRSVERFDTATLASLGPHVTLREQQALWSWKLGCRPSTRAWHSKTLAPNEQGRLIVTLSDTELLGEWVRVAVRGSASILVIDAPEILVSADRGLWQTLVEFCAVRSRSLLLGFEQHDQIPRSLALPTRLSLV